MSREITNRVKPLLSGHPYYTTSNQSPHESSSIGFRLNAATVKFFKGGPLIGVELYYDNNHAN